MAEIYALLCPESDEIRYIGKANDSQKRLKSHLKDSRTRKTPVYDWIRKLLSQGLSPKVKVLEVADDWTTAERRLIALHRASGRLLNVADGGDEPYCSKETRAENGRKVAKKIHSDPRLRAIWVAKKGIAHLLSGYVKNGDVENAEKIRAKMKHWAATRPDVFGEWSAL